MVTKGVIAYSVLSNEHNQPPGGHKEMLSISWLTKSALVHEPKCGGRGGVAESQPMSTAVHTEPKLNFGDLAPYLTYASPATLRNGNNKYDILCTSLRFPSAGSFGRTLLS